MSEQIDVGVNGYGRIGTVFTRAVLNDPDKHIRIAAINAGTRFDSRDIAVRTEYDSTHGYLVDHDYKVPHTENSITPLKRKMELTGFRSLDDANWGDYGNLIVVDSTGAFTSSIDASGHIDAGARGVVITSPAKDIETQTIVCGANDDIDKLDSVNAVVAASSCSTNSISPVLRVLSDNFMTRWGIATIPHAYTNSQRGLDGNGMRSVDRRSSNALIPASTGSAREVARLFPHLDFFKAESIRAPVPSGSVASLHIAVDGKIQTEDVREVLETAAATTHKDIIKTVDRGQTSAKVIGSIAASTIDTRQISTQHISGQTLVSLQSWFDNEYGYSSQVARLVRFVDRYLEA